MTTTQAGFWWNESRQEQEQVAPEESYQWIDSIARAMIDNHWSLHQHELHALGYLLREELDSRNCKKWRVEKIRRPSFHPAHTQRITYEIEVDNDNDQGVTVQVSSKATLREEQLELLRFGASRFVNPHGDDATYGILDVAFSIVWPESYSQCNDCNALIMHERYYDCHDCEQCGACQNVCELGCYEWGGLVCNHHARPFIPVSVFEAHDEDWASAEAAVEAAVTDAQV